MGDLLISITQIFKYQEVSVEIIVSQKENIIWAISLAMNFGERRLRQKQKG